MPPNTDDIGTWAGEDVPMPSIWVIVGAAIGAINLRLIIPAAAAFLGIGKYAARA